MNNQLLWHSKGGINADQRRFCFIYLISGSCVVSVFLFSQFRKCPIYSCKLLSFRKKYNSNVNEHSKCALNVSCCI